MTRIIALPLLSKILQKDTAKKLSSVCFFLLKNLLAIKDECIPLAINRLYFFTNSEKIASSLKFNLSGLNIPYEVITFDINTVSAGLFLNLDKGAVYYLCCFKSL